VVKGGTSKKIHTVPPLAARVSETTSGESWKSKGSTISLWLQYIRGPTERRRRTCSLTNRRLPISVVNLFILTRTF
jgi:hypothetical protein